MIEKTTDYKIFKKLEINRPINEGNLKRIRNSITARNLLHLCPIIVNSKFEVVDGQHRLEAAKLLELPIYYQIEEESAEEDIILLNANQRNWAINDYLNFYVSKHNPNYIALNDFCKKNNLAVSFALSILAQKGGSYWSGFKRGAYLFPERPEKAEESLFQLKEVKKIMDEKFIGSKKFTEGSQFKCALADFLSLKSVFFDVFVKKLVVNLQWIRACAKKEDYMDIFKHIYNFKNQTPI